MTKIGFHASHEQFAPSELLALVGAAERAGFDAAMCADHFAPWSERQGQSGFSWAWLGAALARTSDLAMGTVTAPGQRYHPAIVAQAAATLAEMFPGRFWLAVGSGLLLNEHITGDRWPSKQARNARLLEAVGVMRALWAGETVSFDGSFTVDEARLYTRPAEPPRIFGAALTPKTAAWVASWADGLITVAHPEDELRAVVDAFRGGGGEGKPMHLQVQISYARTDDAAVAAAHDQWRTNIFASSILSDLRSPAQFDAAAEMVRPDDLRGPVRVSSDLGQHAAWLHRDLELGFDELYLHQVGRDQARFIEVFAERVLPELRGRAR